MRNDDGSMTLNRRNQFHETLQSTKGEMSCEERICLTPVGLGTGAERGVKLSPNFSPKFPQNQESSVAKLQSELHIQVS